MTIQPPNSKNGVWRINVHKSSGVAIIWHLDQEWKVSYYDDLAIITHNTIPITQVESYARFLIFAHTLYEKYSDNDYTVGKNEYMLGGMRITVILREIE